MKCPKCKKDDARTGAFTDEGRILWLHCQECPHYWSIRVLTPAMMEAVKELKNKFLLCNKKDIEYATAFMINEFG